LTTAILQADRLPALLDAARQKARLVAPARDGDLLRFRPVASAVEIAPRTDYINPRTSIKEFFFPRSEPLIRFERSPEGYAIAEPDTSFPPTILFGCRPCDARSLLVMDPLWRWDYTDSLWFARRAATTVIALSCTRADEACFCTALGSAPNATAGSDLLLTPLDDARYLAETLTPKGQAIVALMPDAFSPGTADKQAPCKAALDALPPRLDLDRIAAWLRASFENDSWAPWSFKCWGCGCCTFLCPTCHCFDIVDEGTYRRGSRRKNWDACQFALFTLHASGHNPRPDQAARWRNRLQHKYATYVAKFGHRSCVGCGRCIRHCPVNMNILAQLQQIATL
jgi:ferredoxin